VDGAQERAQHYVNEAKRAVERFGKDASVLADLADLVINRES
jgi:geranylgeranyl pyrophosphate synthase